MNEYLERLRACRDRIADGVAAKEERDLVIFQALNALSPPKWDEMMEASGLTSSRSITEARRRAEKRLFPDEVEETERS